VVGLLLVLVVGILASSGCVLARTCCQWRRSTQAVRELIAAAVSIARVVDSGIQDERRLRGGDAVWNQIQKAIWLNPDVLSIDIYIVSDGSLSRFVSGRPHSATGRADGMSATVLSGGVHMPEVFTLDGERLLRIVGPIHAGRRIVGASELVLTMEALRETEARNLLEAGFIILGIFAALAIGLMIGMRFVVLEPLDQIAGMAARVAQGDLDHGVEIPGDDEIADLSRQLNQMTLSLKSAIRDLRAEVANRKEAEEALLEIQSELEVRVQDRTAELLQAKLEAERASRAKSHFLSRMSHELRTPLNAILGFGQLLQLDQGGGRLAEDDQVFVDQILGSGRHLLDLINEVLDLSKIESESLSFELRDVAARSMFDECLHQISIGAGARSLRVVDLTSGSDLPSIRADPVRLRQVLLNLLTNAVKYNRDGGQIALDCHPTDDGMVRISVNDTGQGIPVGNQSRVFEPFERLGAEKSAVEGTGIGLTIAKQLAERMGGRIGFVSTEGIGSTFWIDAPIAREISSDMPEPSVRAKSGD